MTDEIFNLDPGEEIQFVEPKAKTVEFFVDLQSGWQDQDNPHIWIRTQRDLAHATDPDPFPGSKRFRVLVDLPTFGGSAEAEQTIQAKGLREEKKRNQHEEKPD